MPSLNWAYQERFLILFRSDFAMRRFLRSFVYAWQGIWLAIKEERNFRFHLSVAFYVFLFSLFYGFNRLEYSLLILAVVGELALELVNSSLERAVANPAPTHFELAGYVKDLAAGAVLVFSLGVLVCGFFLFWDLAVFSIIFQFFKTHPWSILLLALSFFACVRFVFFFPNNTSKKKENHT